MIVAARPPAVYLFPQPAIPTQSSPILGQECQNMAKHYLHLDAQRDFDYDKTSVEWELGRLLRDLSEAHFLLRRCESMCGMNSRDGGVLDALSQMLANLMNAVADSYIDDESVQVVKAWRKESDAAHAAYRRKNESEVQ
jgi:hypothetical protein